MFFMKKIYILLICFPIIQVSAQIKCDWAYIPSGNSITNNISHISTDQDGNILSAGTIHGIADMDPSDEPGDTSFSKVSYNYYISKTNNKGKLLWIKYFTSPKYFGKFEIKGLEVNSKKEIILIGNFFGLVDFDLTVKGIDTLRSHFQTYPDYFVAKYDTDGNLKWVFNIGDPTTSNMEAQSLSLGLNDDIFVVANPNGTIDVDPGTAVHNSIGGNANVICYSTDGKYLWNNNIAVKSSIGITCQSLNTDFKNNSYLMSVGYYELTVSKFNNTGGRIWNKTLGSFASGSRVTPQSILVEKTSSNFYLCGTFSDTIDFDPGIGVNKKIASSTNFQDGFIAKYDSNMNLIWVNTYKGNVLFGNYGLKFKGNDIVVVGSLLGTVDFGNANIFSSQAQASAFYLELNKNGEAKTGFVLNGTGNFNSVNFNSNQTFTITGSVWSATDMDPGANDLTLNPTKSRYFYGVYSNTLASVKYVTGKQEIKVFPNPTSNMISINMPVKFTGLGYIIHNEVGQVMQRGDFKDNNTNINFEAYPEGVYFMQIENNENQTIKIIKRD